MVNMLWANADVLNLPEMGAFRGQEDFEALLAMSRFTNSVPTDCSGSLAWPFPFTQRYDYAGAVTPTPVADVMDARAQGIWAANPAQVAVLCAGDIDSVAVLAALVKHAPAPDRVVVRHTQAGRTRYPALFSQILPALGVTMENRDGLLLVGDSTVPYCDGRSGDDWQAGYQASVLGSIRELVNTGSVEDIVDHMVYVLAMEDAQRATVARQGLLRFAASAPFPVTNAWSFVVAMYRCCVTQPDVMNGPVTEDDPANALAVRVPFYDHPSFTAASAFVAQQGAMPTPDNESLGLRQYALSVFGDEDWAAEARPSSVYYFYRLGKYNTHWLDQDGVPRPYTEFPVGGSDFRPATWEQIKYWRDTHEIAPIATSFGVFDCDERSDARMDGSIEQFDSLPTLQEGKLTWKRADNTSLPVTKTELEQIYAQVKTARASRGALLHVQAEVFRQADPAPTLAQLSDLSFWLGAW